MVVLRGIKGHIHGGDNRRNLVTRGPEDGNQRCSVGGSEAIATMDSFSAPSPRKYKTDRLVPQQSRGSQDLIESLEETMQPCIDEPDLFSLEVPPANPFIPFPWMKEASIHTIRQVMKAS